MLRNLIKCLTILSVSLSFGCNPPEIESCKFYPDICPHQGECLISADEPIATCLIKEWDEKGNKKSVEKTLRQLIEHIAIPVPDLIAYIRYCQKKK